MSGFPVDSLAVFPSLPFVDLSASLETKNLTMST